MQNNDHQFLEFDSRANALSENANVSGVFSSFFFRFRIYKQII